MTVEIKAVNRTHTVKANLYIEYWVQIDAGLDTLYGQTEDDGFLNTLGRVAANRTRNLSDGTIYYGGTDPGEYDAGESNAAWYGQSVRIPFTRSGLPPTGWHTLLTEMRDFLTEAFPDEIVLEPNRRLERPAPGDISAPVSFIIWTIEYE